MSKKPKKYPALPSIIIKNAEQIVGIRKSCQLAKRCLDYIQPFVKPGAIAADLDSLMDKYIRDNNAIPACLNYKNFPKSVCISINEVVCHGIPDSYVLGDGDIVNIDVTTILDGYFGDTCRMYEVGTVSQKAKNLIEVTKNALNIGISQVYPRNKIGGIGAEIFKYATKMGYSVVDSFCGHGTGLAFHEPPQVPNSAPSDYGDEMLPGMIFTIEPMINIGGDEVFIDKVDEWTVRTKDGSLSAQFEHTVLVTEFGVEILTL
jgi:methionyl aminopeptidase